MWRGTPGTTLDKGWLPNITGYAYNTNTSAGSVYLNQRSGCFILPTTLSPTYPMPHNVSGTDHATALNFSAENSCSIYSASNTSNWVLPRSISVYMCIKYI